MLLSAVQQTQFDTVKSGSKQLWVSCATTGLQAYAPLNLTDGNASRLVITAQPTKLDVFEVWSFFHFSLMICTSTAVWFFLFLSYDIVCGTIQVFHLYCDWVR